MNKEKNLNKIIGIIIIIFCAFGGLLSYFQDETSTNENEDLLKIYYFDVGQADCTLVISDGQTMLIDGGNEADSEHIINYIKNTLGISKLDYVIATHPDSDHIAGLDKIILAFETDIIYIPITTKSGKEIDELNEAITDKTVINPSRDDYFYLGNSKCTILNAGDNSKISDNNSSIVIQLNYGEFSCLFMGDLEKAVENTLTLEDIDVLKVAHHGSEDATSMEFLNSVKPEYSIISVDSTKSDNHPATQTLNNLEAVNSTICRTDIDGTIILTSDGTSYYFEFAETSLDGN